MLGEFSWRRYRSVKSGVNRRATFGSRALSQDYSDGSGADKFEWDMTLHGPIAALAISF